MNRQTIYQQKHKQLGLCVKCPNKAKENTLLCLAHWEKQKKYNKAWNIKNPERRKKIQTLARIRRQKRYKLYKEFYIKYHNNINT